MTEPNQPTEPAGDPQVEPTSQPADPAQGKGDIPAGDKRAILADLAKERDKRQALEKQLAELAPLAALKPVADLLGGKPTGDAKTDLEKLTERLDDYERQITEERMARWRAEVAAEKGLTPTQAARLQGATREELAADADALLDLFAARTPAPDPSQGARSSSTLPAQVTREELERMTPQEVDKARREGRLDKLLGKTN